MLEMKPSNTFDFPCSITEETQFLYYETIKRELNKRLIYECQCDERLKAKAERSTRLAYTGLRGGLEHLKIETRLIYERFASVMGQRVVYYCHITYDNTLHVYCT